MIISHEQVRLAAEYLQTPECSEAARQCRADRYGVSSDLVAKIQEVLAGVPDTRQDRVDHARRQLSAAGLTGAEVAEKMIGRIVSDSIR